MVNILTHVQPKPKTLSLPFEHFHGLESSKKQPIRTRPPHVQLETNTLETNTEVSVPDRPIKTSAALETPSIESCSNTLEQYFSDIRKINLLTREEVALSQRIEAGKLARERLERERTVLAAKDKDMLETF
jgi:Sigma-70 factor, region 1.2